MSKQIIVDLDDMTAADLEAVAPSRARKRSDFVRQALRRALDAALEQRMAEAYRRQPQDEETCVFEPEAWEPSPRSRRRANRR